MGVWIETALRSATALQKYVTPFVGVWIETLDMSVTYGYAPSHPSWVCGLKRDIADGKYTLKVTPFVGVWIETVYRHILHVPVWVTPFVGVWIETLHFIGR